MATRKLPGPDYHVAATFRAPLDFAFRWCTDYAPEDAGLEGESYDRRVVKATRRRVIFEDVEWTRAGWDWSRSVVTLRPPRGWHLTARGSRVDVEADYRLTPLPNGGTRLDITWRRKPNAPPLRRITKTQREAMSTASWRRFSTALDRDFRARRPG
jgi:hypothetical protein